MQGFGSIPCPPPLHISCYLNLFDDCQKVCYCYFTNAFNCRSDAKFSSSEDIHDDDINNSSSVSASSSPPTAATPPRKLYHSKSTNLPPENNDEMGKLVHQFLIGKSFTSVHRVSLLRFSCISEPPKVRSISNHSGTSSSQRCYSGSSSSIQNVDKKTASPIVDVKVPLYSNIKYSFPQNHSPMLPLDQYIREQAVLSGM